jgi:ABC-type arginine transport system ATPase subunit
MKRKYQLRHAAGRYWLLDMEQSGKEYHKPIVMNESGAVLWQYWQSGATQEEMVSALCRIYKIEENEARHDAAVFLEKIQNQL